MTASSPIKRTSSPFAFLTSVMLLYAAIVYPVSIRHAVLRNREDQLGGLAAITGINPYNSRRCALGRGKERLSMSGGARDCGQAAQTTLGTAGVGIGVYQPPVWRRCVCALIDLLTHGCVKAVIALRKACDRRRPSTRETRESEELKGRARASYSKGWVPEQSDHKRRCKSPVAFAPQKRSHSRLCGPGGNRNYALVKCSRDSPLVIRKRDPSRLPVASSLVKTLSSSARSQVEANRMETGLPKGLPFPSVAVLNLIHGANGDVALCPLGINSSKA